MFAANIEDVSEQQNNKFKDVSVTYTLIADDPNFKYKIDRFGQFVDGQENYGPSLMVGETYRYGFVYYTSDGQRSSVLNITDVEVPEDIKYINKIEKVDEYYTEFNRIGVKFTISNLPDDCIGYEVVRCERTVEDSNTITQGIIGCTFGTEEFLTYSILKIRILLKFPMRTSIDISTAFPELWSSSSFEKVIFLLNGDKSLLLEPSVYK